MSDWSSRRGTSIYTAVAEVGGANWWQIKTFFAVGAYSLNFTIVKWQVLVSKYKYNFNCKCFVLDFERHDDDELGFRKNDIITIISQKDEHCWVGELNGLRGENITFMCFLVLYSWVQNLDFSFNKDTVLPGVSLLLSM